MVTDMERGMFVRAMGSGAEAQSAPILGVPLLMPITFAYLEDQRVFRGQPRFHLKWQGPQRSPFFEGGGGSHLLMLTPFDGVYNTRRAYLRRVRNANAYCANALRGFVIYIWVSRLTLWSHEDRRPCLCRSDQQNHVLLSGRFYEFS